MTDYNKTLKKTMAEEGASNAYKDMPTAKLREGIAAISSHLKGPMPANERIWDASIRRGMQEELLRRGEPLHPKGNNT